MDPRGVPVTARAASSATRRRSRRRAGTHAAGAGRGPDRVGTAARRPGSLGACDSPAAARQDADHAGQGGREADVYLETALAEFRALGERFGISFARTELADRIAVRGEFAAAGEHYEQAIAVVTEIGCRRGRHPVAVAAGAAVLAAGRRGRPARPPSPRRNATRNGSPGRTRWLSWPSRQAELARWNGDAEEARKQLGLAASLLGDEAEQPNIRAGNARPARLPRRRPQRGPRAPCGGLPGGGRGGIRAAARAGARRRRGPGAAPRPVRAGRATARGKHRRAGLPDRLAS